MKTIRKTNCDVYDNYVKKMKSEKYLLILIILVLSTHFGESLFKNAVKKLKEKAKNAYKKKFGKNKLQHFLGFDLTEYPGTNEKYRQINKDKWEAYYDCLRELDKTHDKAVTPVAIQGFKSHSVRLQCKLCLSPSEAAKIDSVEWDWAGVKNSTMEPVDYTESILITPQDRSLHIYDLQMEHSGQYACRIGQEQSAPIFLTVIDPSDEDLLQVHSLEAPKGPYPQGYQPIPGYNLALDTEWMPWSPCSKCNQIGRKHRLGFCKILYGSSKNLTTSNSTPVQPLPSGEYEIVKAFVLGLPCSSHILPRSIAKIEQVKERKNEVMDGFCKEDCPEDQIFEVVDKDGNVLEVANNSAGIYSTLQGMPPQEPPVGRQLLYAIKGKKAVIECPGNLNSEIPVQWQIGPKKLVPELLTAESKGRIYISISDKIHFKEAKLSDSKIYSCWQHHDLAGTVRLVVEKQTSLDFNHHIMLFGSVAIFGTFLYIFFKSFVGRKRAKGQQ